jgi:hypothetical protein
MKEKVEVQIVLDNAGVKCVRIAGSPEEHRIGHDLYFMLRDLIDNFDKAIKERLQENINGDSNLNA